MATRVVAKVGGTCPGEEEATAVAEAAAEGLGEAAIEYGSYDKTFEIPALVSSSGSCA